MALKVKFQSNGGGGTMLPVTFEENNGTLPKNEFVRSGFKFVGWADTKENSKIVNYDRLQFGKVKYPNRSEIRIKDGGIITLYACWQGTGVEAACTWAMLIASDNSFMYGVGSRAHHNGCYFCGTNRSGKKKASKGDRWDKTYCCNPFVGAAFAHGMGMNGGKCWSTGLSQSSWEKKGFKKVSSPTIGKLLPGDLLLKPDKHIKLYLGNNKVAHAAQEGWTDKSIRVNSYNKIESQYIVMRYKNVTSSNTANSVAMVSGAKVEDTGAELSTVEQKKKKEKLITKYGNEARTYFYLREHGWTHKGTCGVMGNINQESGFKTGAVSFDGYGSLGICQWTFDRKTNLLNFLSAHSYGKESLQGQCAFLDYETKKNYSKLYKILTEKTDLSVTEITEKFCWEWERPAKEYAHIEHRIESAKTYYERYSGNGDIGEISSGGNVDFNLTTSKLISSDNMTYVVQEQEEQGATETSTDKFIKDFKSAYTSTSVNSVANILKNVASKVDFLVSSANSVVIPSTPVGVSTFGSYVKGSTLPIYKTFVEAPFVEVVLNGVKFGTYNVRNGYGSYPSYVQSVDIKKTNGTLNEYTITLVHQIAPGDNPNYIAQLLSSVGYSEIKISYGDANSGTFFQDVSAFITGVQTSFNFSSHMITYVISASSLSYLTSSTKMNFPSTKDKPSNVILDLLKHNQSFVLQYFKGMSNIDKVTSMGLIPTNDAVVDISAVRNKNIIEYISYLVSLMKNEVEEIAEKSTYYFVINDSSSGDTKNTFSIKEVISGKDIVNEPIYEVDVGYPDDNMVFDFSINSNYAWSMAYNNSFKVQNYNYMIDDTGNVNSSKATSLLKSDLSSNLYDIDMNTWKQLTRFPISASLTVKGLVAPLMLLTYIRVNNYYYGKKRITSGLYIVTEQRDSVSTSGCRTTLGLTRVASDVESISVDGRVRT